MNDIEDNYILSIIKKFRNGKLSGSFKIYLKCGEVSNVVEEISTLRKDF